MHIPDFCDEITVFGAGRAIDVGKYLAFIHGKSLNIIPSLLSTNAPGTPFGCYENLSADTTKTTIQVGYPRTILVDFAYLGSLEKKNLFELADVLSIGTALHDWNLAIQQDPSVADFEIYQKARSILESCLTGLDSGTLNTRTAFNLIINSAYITGLYGNGRPESGSEHIFSKLLELEALRQGRPIMHGISVAIGIAPMATLQDNPDKNRLLASIRKLDLLSEYKNRRDELEKVATATLTQLEPHPIRYSVVNARLIDLHNNGFAADLAHQVVKELLGEKLHE